MKQKDIAVLIVVAFISAIASLLLSKSFFATAQDQSQKVESIDAISAEIKPPNKKYFNDKSVDPAQLVEVGDSDNQNPFSPSSR